MFGGVVWALIVRGVYVWIRNRRAREPHDRRKTFSWWLVPLAVVFTFFGVAGQAARDTEDASEEAVRQGIVASPEEADPVDRCVAANLREYDALGETQRGRVKRSDVRAIVTEACERADREGILTPNGMMSREDGDRIIRDVIADFRASGRL